LAGWLADWLYLVDLLSLGKILHEFAPGKAVANFSRDWIE